MTPRWLRRWLLPALVAIVALASARAPVQAQPASQSLPAAALRGLMENLASDSLQPA